MSSLKIGQSAPAFALYNTNKENISLESMKGKNVVILFFPLAFTGVCTKELCTIRDTYAQYNQLDAEVLGISVDSLFTLDKFKSEQGLNFMLLSDFNKEASKAYDVLYDTFPAFEMKGVSKRAAFVVNKQGVIIHEEVCPTPGDLPSFDNILRALKNA